MNQASAEPCAWARLHVLRGAPPQQRVFRQGEPARCVIGSSPECDLRIARTEVAPRQLEVVWDGTHLWLTDPLRLGHTYVWGKRLNEWQVVTDQAIVSFASVRLAIIACGVPTRASAPDFRALERASLVADDAELRSSDTRKVRIPAELLRALRDGER